MPEENIQQIADRVNLGPHQGMIEPLDENGQSLKFVVHRPTMHEQVKIGVSVANMLTNPTIVKDGEVQVGEAVTVLPVFDNLASAIATLNVVVDMRPAGIAADVGTWVDETLTFNTYAAFGEWLEKFRAGLLAKSGSDSPTPEPTAPGLAV